MSLDEIEFQSEYRTSSLYEPKDMIRLAISKSILYRRASGYFSSSVFDLFKKETLDFAKKGGAIELMCSPVMTEADLDLIADGYATSDAINHQIIKDIETLASDPQYEGHLSFVATLIKLSILSIKIIFFKNGKGIFHDKTGYFMDAYKKYLSFSGSANDSSFAFSGQGNFERIQVFASWKAVETSRCESDLSYVNDLWFNRLEGLAVVEFPEVARDILLKYSRESLEELEPSFSYYKPKKTKTLMEHQFLALKNWRSSGRRGILKHATGSGKTITAINAIKEHLENGKPAIVLVPSKLLLDQWYNELKEEVEDAVILRCGGGHVAWRRNNTLKKMLIKSEGTDFGGVVLAVNDSASSEGFSSQLVNREEILLVADEVHAIGSPKVSKLMEYDFAYRLGLSATPERYCDPEGTEKLFSYFGGIVEPEVTLKDALASGRLVPYDYFPETTTLNATEEAQWEEFTTKILNYIRCRDVENDNLRKDTILQLLLINRARLAKKASSKVEKVCEIISKNFNETQHWLVYCEDSKQLEEINSRLASMGFNALVYTSAMDGSPLGELEAFTAKGGILLSIRCLDEGVDIPKISHAIIAASSQNPRQFIQRRGRVLRKAEGKINAVLYDCIVVPSDTQKNTVFDGLVVGELTRAMEFAGTARNVAAAESTLRNILIGVGTNPDSIIQNLDGDREDDNR